jgi:hypothetical protein
VINCLLGSPADDDDTDSMSTISEASEVGTPSVRGRRGKAAEPSPASSSKQGARLKRTTLNESKVIGLGVVLTLLGTDCDFCHQRRETEIAQKLSNLLT